MHIEQISRDCSAFQQPVNEQALSQALAEHLTGETILAVKELHAGLFNNTYHVQTERNQYVLKIAPSKQQLIFYNELNLMGRERTLVNTLESASPLIPHYIAFFRVDERDAFIQTYVHGRTWQDEIESLSETENNQLWSQLGYFASTIHSVEGERFGFPTPGKRFTSWYEFFLDTVEGNVKDCQALTIDMRQINVFLERLPHFQQTLNNIERPRLLHGDIWPRNVIIDGTGERIKINAVIDAERAFWGDPICDWVLLLFDLPDAFWQGYGRDLLAQTDPVLVSIYKGMYFIQNCLEKNRDLKSDQLYQQLLSDINVNLTQYLNS